MKKIIAIILLLCVFIPINTYALDEEVIFVQCDSGKTAKFRDKENELIDVNLLGIIIPEKMEEKTYEYICNLLAKADSIKLEYDEEASETDSLGKKNAWVFVDDLLLQDILVKEGYANISSQIAEYKYMDELKESLSEAKENEKGLWNTEEKIEKEVEEVKEEKPKKKGFWKQVTSAIFGFIDQILDGILKFIESML